MTSDARAGTTQMYDERLQALAAGPHPPALIVIGNECGELLAEITRRMPETNVLALAPRAAAAERLATRADVSTRIEQGRLRVLAGPDYAAAIDAWRLFTGVAAMPPMLVDPGFEEAQPGEAERAKVVAAKVVLGTIQNQNARRRFAGPYLLNTLANLPVIAAEGSAAALDDAFAGVPAVIVGAGPSLDRTIDQMAALADRSLLIAVDTAVRPLLAAGVRPHLVVSVDPSDVNARHIEDLPDTRGMWLVAEGSLYPTVFPSFEGRTFVFKVSDHDPWPWIAAAGSDKGQLQAWGSVLTTAFDLAYRAGCNPIVFVGADLAYTDGELYCRNTIYEADWSHLATKSDRAVFFERAYFATQTPCMEPDVNGAPVRSAARFLQFRDWLVARAKAAAGREVVNATGGGILHGMSIVQRDVASVAAQLPAGSRGPAIATRLAAAWNQSSGGEADRRLAQNLRELQPCQIDSWTEFAAGTVSRAQIDDRVRFAVAGLADAAHGWTARRKKDLATLVAPLGERRALLKQIQILERERDEARTERDAARSERDSAHRERALARQEAAAFLGHYPAWRVARLRYVIDCWGERGFRKTRVLELGCGHGDIGAFFLCLGADVTFCDAREEHLAVVSARYPGASILRHDGNLPLPADGRDRYDYVLHMGFLNHLHPDAVAASILDACRLGRRIVLEMEVCDSLDPDLVVRVPESGIDQAVDGIGARPSSAFIERVLDQSGARWQRHDDRLLNSGFHVYDWAPRHDGRYFDAEAARRDPRAVQQALRRFYTIDAS